MTGSVEGSAAASGRVRHNIGEVLDVLRGLAEEGMTMIVVTHELSFAREVGDRVVFMDDGAIVEQGPPSQVLDNPREERTRKFLGLVLDR